MVKRYCGGNPALLGKYVAMRGGSARMRGEKDGRQPDDTTPPAPAPKGDHPNPQPPARQYPVADFDAFRPWLAAYQNDWFGWRTFGNTRLRDARQFRDWLLAYGGGDYEQLEVADG